MSDAPGPPPRARLRRGPSARSPAPASAGASDPASVLVAMASAPNVAAAAWTIGATPALSSNRRRASFAGRLGGGVGIGGGGGGGGAPGDMPAVIFEEGGRGGGASLVTLRREEVLRECAVAGGGDGGGTVGVPVVQKRDMRLLDGASANARAALLARRGVALVRLGAVKAVILPHKCYVLLAAGAAPGVSALALAAFNERLRDAPVTRGGTDGPASDVAGAPFHMRALDAVLVTAVGATVGEFERARGVAAAVLGRLRAGGATTQTANELRLIKARLSAFDAHSARVHGAISAVIDDNDAMLAIGEMGCRDATAGAQSSPDAPLGGIADRHAGDPGQEVETLLEGSLMELDAAMQNATELQREIDFDEANAALVLELKRNRMNYVNNVLTLIAATMAAATMFCGAFSMNVPNVNYSDPEQTWWNMVAIICGVIGLAPLVPVSLWMLRYTD